jgi:hypothetical protein
VENAAAYVMTCRRCEFAMGFRNPVVLNSSVADELSTQYFSMFVQTSRSAEYSANLEIIDFSS